MIESVEQARELAEQAQATDQLLKDWQDLYYSASYLRGRGDDPFADNVWQELEAAHQEGVAPPPQVVHTLRAQLEAKLYAQWQALYDGAVALKESGYDPFSAGGWEDLRAAKDAKSLDTLALTTHYLQPSLARMQSQVIQELIQVARMLQDQGDDPLSVEDWEWLLAPEKTPEEERALIQMLMPRLVDILHTWLQKLDVTAQQFQAAGYTPFISDWRRLHQAIERRSLRELTAAIRIFPAELEEHIRLRLSYWSEKADQLETLQEQLELQKNRNQAADLMATYKTGLNKLKSLDRKDAYRLDTLHAMVLAISGVESSWRGLVALSQSEERLAQGLRWATGGIIVVFLALIVAAAAMAPRLTAVNEPMPLLGIPPSVILWSFIGSFVAVLMRFIRRKFWDVGDFFKWFLARSLVGFIIGAALYLVVVSGFFVFGVVIGAPSDTLNTLPRPEVFWLLAFAGASNDRIAEKVLSTATGWSIRLFRSAPEAADEAGREPTDEPEGETGEE
jgi:hypothetical protein